MLIYRQTTLSKITMGDLVAVELPDMCVTGKVTATNPAQGTLSFVPFACVRRPDSGTGFGISWFEQTAAIETIKMGENGPKLQRAEDSEATVTYPLTWERIAELEPCVEALLTEIQAECPTEWNYFRIWYGYKERLSELVGWDREKATHPELRSSAAYNVVYHKLLDCLTGRLPT